MATASQDRSSVLNKGELAYKGLLYTHRHALVLYLVDTGFEQVRAEAMVDQLWMRVVQRIAKNYAHLGIDLPMAERRLNEALGYMALIALEPGYSPSWPVDLALHELVL